MSNERAYAHPAFHGGKNNSEQVTDEYLTCPISGRPGFIHPKILLCGHTFSKASLESYAGGARCFCCPMCGKVTELPSNGVSGLRDNIFIDTQVEMLLSRHNKARGRDDSFYNITKYE
ncbi:DgyrCDS7548 [Dimorphilus gyrociliatus]|uniref:DgyrCDS7548 n=1 Tax=Dimorphilus gyrociliatus TaxID=2664684 RepID=A0A7I8VSB7_9ANNE|nr:DgyrCDS7548 [Dimorphilus gyrociliatus]